MDKYGVEEREDKVASDEEACPKCDKEIEDKEETGVKKCPDCGTEPFE
jgi:ribosomal protein L37AE/L43A